LVHGIMSHLIVSVHSLMFVLHVALVSCVFLVSLMMLHHVGLVHGSVLLMVLLLREKIYAINYCSIVNVNSLSIWHVDSSIVWISSCQTCFVLCLHLGLMLHECLDSGSLGSSSLFLGVNFFHFLLFLHWIFVLGLSQVLMRVLGVLVVSLLSQSLRGVKSTLSEHFGVWLVAFLLRCDVVSNGSHLIS